MRLLIWVAGGSRLGMGHVYRSLELARTLEADGIAIVGFVCNDDARSRELITQSGRTCWPEQKFPSAGIDAVLVDRPTGADGWVAAWRAAHPGVRVAALDDFQMEVPVADLVINLINHHPMLSRPLASEVVYREGPEFAIVRGEFLSMRKTRAIAAHATQLVITFGGADPANHSARVLEALAGPGFANLRTRLVIGPNFAHAAAIETLARERAVEIVRNPPNLAGLFASADLAVSGGGTTMLELACVGTPTLVIPQTEAEARFAASFAARDAVVALPSDVAPARLGTALSRLLEDQPWRQRLSGTARQIVDGCGQRRIAELLLATFARRSS